VTVVESEGILFAFSDSPAHATWAVGIAARTRRDRHALRDLPSKPQMPLLLDSELFAFGKCIKRSTLLRA
jgi:hypothetical protein